LIGIVVVSHSPALADAAVALALEMVAGSPPPIAVAAGAGEGVVGEPITGTDATAVAAAIDEVASPDGVLVFMDLGSAVLSASMALEFTETDAEVRLSDAPFVEGVVAGIVLAAAGATLADAAREASSAMTAKNAQLETAAPDQAGASAVSNGATEVTLVNPLGLHARPASMIVAAMGGLDAEVSVTDLASPDRTVSAGSLMGLMSLGAAGGHTLRVDGSGPDAAKAVEAIRAMAEDGFGELA
jgi:PTS hybrid protein